MNKKTLILLISLALVLVAGITAGIFCLYKDDGGKGHVIVKTLDRYPVIAAVPSDAMALAVFDSSSDGVSKLLDDSSLWSALAYDSKDSPYYEFLSGIKNFAGRLPMALSLHNCGSVVPVIVFDAGKNASDSTKFVKSVLGQASRAGLSAAFHRFGERSYIISSSSSVLVASSISHIDEGMSVAVNESFCSCASSTSSPAVFFFSNSYSSKLMPSFFSVRVSSQAEKVKRFAAWTAVSENTFAERKRVYAVSASLNRNSYLNFYSAKQQSDCRFPEAAPSSTMFALALPIVSVDGCVESYDSYMDGLSRLSSVRSLRNRLSEATGVKPLDWAKSLDVKEIARVQWYRGTELLEACLLRAGERGCQYIYKGLEEGINEKNYVASPRPYVFAGYASSLFGENYSLVSDSYFAYRDGWIISGSEEAVSDILARGSSLKASLSTVCPDIVPSRAGGLVMYFAAGSCRMEDVFAKSARRAAEDMQFGASRVDACLSMHPEGLELHVERPLADTPDESPELTVTGAGLEVPKGPFKVRNCATKQINTLSQQSNHYLTLSDEKGKAMWSVEFHEPLCGRVEEVDHYNNGKIQFLFTAGSNLWLLDRLGRFVSGFPKALPQTVLLGPAVHELTEGRTLAFIYADGSIGFTDMNGKKRDFWKGVTVPGQPVALPELLKTPSGKFWIIRTLKDARIYPYEGGEAVYAKAGKDAIRSDSPVRLTEKGSVSIVTNEGKEKTVKL